MTTMHAEATAEPRMKAEIRGIGICWHHPPDHLGRTWTAQNWAMEGGDYPAFDLTASRLGGWTLAELALLSDLAMAAGSDVALERANAYREVPADVPVTVIEVPL